MDEFRAWLRLILHLPLLILVAIVGVHLGWRERRSGRWIAAEARGRMSKELTADSLTDSRTKADLRKGTDLT